MLIVFDEVKRLANLDRHGLDFEAFEREFDFTSYIVLPARRSRTGRAREMFIGMMGERTVVAIISPLGTEALAIVSLRHASPRERKLYEEAR